MIKFIGISIILISALLIFAEIKKRADLCIKQCEETMRLIRHIRVRLECYLSPISELCAGFKSDVLSECGILSEEKICSKDCFLNDNRILMPMQIREMLYSYFNDVGSSYMESEISKIKELEASIDSSLKEFVKEMPRRVKCYGVMTVSLALGITILLI